MSSQLQKNTKAKLKHKCDFCDKAFPFKSLLKAHTMIHTGERPYVCDICQKTFRTKGHLKNHSLIHSNDKPYMCNICGKEFRTKSEVDMHAVTHSEEKPFTCDMCGKKFGAKRYLRRHKLIHLGEKAHICDKCGKGFTQSSDLKRHRLVHTGEKPYSCQDCGEKFRRKDYIMTHRQIHLDELHYSNMWNEKYYRNYLDCHIRTKNTFDSFRCKNCGRRFPVDSAFKLCRYKHYMCAICKKIFRFFILNRLYVTEYDRILRICDICKSVSTRKKVVAGHKMFHKRLMERLANLL